jgi:hypothetical protein
VSGEALAPGEEVVARSDREEALKHAEEDDKGWETAEPFLPGGIIAPGVSYGASTENLTCPRLRSR